MKEADQLFPLWDCETKLEDEVTAKPATAITQSLKIQEKDQLMFPCPPPPPLHILSGTVRLNLKMK